AVVAEGGGARSVQPDGIGLHGVAGRGRAVEPHAGPVVAGDDVVGDERPDRRAVGELLCVAGADAAEVIAEGERAGHVRADVVALHDAVAGRVHAQFIAGDDVARGRGRAADWILSIHEDAGLYAVTEGLRAGRVRADQIALYLVAGRVRTRIEVADAHAAAIVAGDEVARAGRRAADEIIVRAFFDEDG